MSKKVLDTEGGIGIPARCSGDAFVKSSFKNIGAFRLAGYFTWNEEAAGSNPVSYTINMGGHVPRLAKNICNVFGRVRFPYCPQKVRWCNG